MEQPITFVRNGSVIVAVVRIKTGHVFRLEWETGTEWAACLLLEAITDALGDRVAKIREQSYNEGWAAAKAKRSKQVSHWMRSLWVRP
jgi:hypothetical protein